MGLKNGLNSICRTCLEEKCGEFDSTRWNLTKIDQFNWKLKPSRPILNEKIDPSIFNIALEGEEDSKSSFDYTIKRVAESTQEFDVNFKFKDDIKDEKIIVRTQQNPENLLYDENRNLLYRDTGESYMDRVCYVSSSRSNVMKALAFIVLICFIVVFAILLLLTILCWKR